MTPLIEALEIIPCHWKIVPAIYKLSQGNNWQKFPFSAIELQSQLKRKGKVSVLDKRGKRYEIEPTGIALILGQQFNNDFLISVDCDGKAAYQKVIELNYDSRKAKNLIEIAHDYFPPTVAWTSGKPYRAQYLYRLPNSSRWRSRIIKTSSQSELLEFRGKNLTSIIPPSLHPEGRRYQFLSYWNINDFQTVNAPEWVIKIMGSSQSKESPKFHPKIVENQQSSVTSSRIIKRARFLLDNIHPRHADDYWSWLRIGIALHNIDDKELLADWQSWSAVSHKYKPGECIKKWASFNRSPKRKITIKTLEYYAKY